MNAARLERIAVAHLERFGSSVENLRRVLRRRIARSCEHHDDDPAAFEAPLHELLLRLQETGVLDDRLYGASVVRSARARGSSSRAIRARLRQKGLAPELCDALLRGERGGGANGENGEIGENRESGEHGDAETEAAWRYARRRRLGPFRGDPELRRASRQRDLAALGRRGFDYPVAARVIDAVAPEAPHG